MNSKYSRLFEPFNIGNVEIKNRFVMAPMGTVQTCTADKALSLETVEYYVRRARGGVGLIITGCHPATVDIEGINYNFFPSPTFNPKKYVETATELTDRVHSFGTKIFMQIGAGFGRSIMPGGAREYIAPSPTPNFWNKDIQHRELTTEEVETLVAKLGEAAVVAKRSGFDGVEIHAMHEGYLLDNFAMSLFNKRTDKYGGDLKGRLTIVIEIVKSIKAFCGEDFPVSMRFGVKSFTKDQHQGAVPGEEFVEKGRDVEESLEAAKILEAAGYDSFNADAGTYDAWYWAHPPMYFEKGLYLPLTEQLKTAVNCPVLVAGRMDNPDISIDALENNKLDAVCLGRPLLSDPDYVNKLRKDRLADIRFCLACHDGCLKRAGGGARGSCAVNPEAARELTMSIQPAVQKKKVVVVGAGLAGMEAARVCALRGHEVTVYEADERIGGVVNAGGAPVFKKDDRELIVWYGRQLEKLGVPVAFETRATKTSIQELNPDTVFVATGSKPIIPPVDGIEKDLVATAVDILLGNEESGDHNVIIGGGLVGCELVLHLVQNGKKALIVEQLPAILQAGVTAAVMNGQMLRDLLAFHNVEIKVSASLAEVTDSGVVIRSGDLSETIDTDRVILACGYQSHNQLFDELRLEFDEIYNIGDSRQVRNIRGAIWDAYEVARSI